MTKIKSGKKVYITLIILSLICVFAIGAFAVFGMLYPKDKFYKNTKINGVDVGGMTVLDASNVLHTSFLSTIDDLSITLKYEDRAWNFTSKDFEVIDDFSGVVTTAFNSVTSANILDRRLKKKQLDKNSGNIHVSLKSILGGLEEKIDSVCNEINQELKEPEIEFNPNNKNIFTFVDGQDEVKVNKEQLEKSIDEAYAKSQKIVVDVPYEKKSPSQTVQDLQNKTLLRSEFSTSYKSSSNNRKSNVKTALNAFNGKIVATGEEVSFNSVTGARTKENGYKSANIILNGVYVEGSGGGVCQASTTLYNALLLANLQILEVSKHSLPASYVPLALDAMVSEGISDLKFKNNTSDNIYIKTWCDDTTANVQIYGLPFENGEYYKTRSEFIKAIPHSGDRIISDVTGKYSNKITFKGEYLRLKYPHEGYEAKSYLQHYSADGTLLDEKLLRHETYMPQEGIIVEGTEDLYEGMVLPSNNVKFIPPQSGSNTNKNNVSNKISGNDNEKYNP